MINPLQVSYPNFELGEIINPDEFDVNFADITIRINQIITVLNQITDGVNGNGTDIIDVGEIAPFFSPKLQGFLEELVAKLNSVAVGDSGAHFIGSEPIPGIPGDSVHEQLSSLTTFFIDLQNKVNNEVARLDGRIDIADGNIISLDSRMSSAESNITNLDASKADRSEVYNKAETEVLLQDLRDSVNAESYTRTQVDDLLEEKVSVGANHTGMWQGINVSDIAGVIGAKGVVIDNAQPSNPTHGLLWFNPLKNEYTIYLNGQWRPTGRLVRYAEVHNRVTVDVETNTVSIGISGFDPTIDLLTVYVNSTYQAKGHDYTINSDGTVTFNKTLAIGTVVDFDARIVTEVE